jgi:hypothetical protein
MAGCRLVTMLVGSRGRVGLVTPTPNGHLPALFGGPFHVRVGFCPLDRAVGRRPRNQVTTRRTEFGHGASLADAGVVLGVVLAALSILYLPPKPKAELFAIFGWAQPS